MNWLLKFEGDYVPSYHNFPYVEREWYNYSFPVYGSEIVDDNGNKILHIWSVYCLGSWWSPSYVSGESSTVLDNFYIETRMKLQDNGNDIKLKFGTADIKVEVERLGGVSKIRLIADTTQEVTVDDVSQDYHVYSLHIFQGSVSLKFDNQVILTSTTTSVVVNYVGFVFGGMSSYHCDSYWDYFYYGYYETPPPPEPTKIELFYEEVCPKQDEYFRRILKNLSHLYDKDNDATCYTEVPVKFWGSIDASNVELEVYNNGEKMFADRVSPYPVVADNQGNFEFSLKLFKGENNIKVVKK